MLTRAWYMAFHEGADVNAEMHKRHRAYYGQFVDDAVRELVRTRIGEARILASENRDGAFNDIPLHEWDQLVSALPSRVWTAIKESGDACYKSLGNGGCVLKEAARQIREEGGKRT